MTPSEHRKMADSLQRVGKCREADVRRELADALQQIADIRAAIEKIVEPEGIDAGVILLSDDSPTHWSEEHQCHVYEHENFSPLGDALVNLWKLAAGKPEAK
jgi:hypothetical protein